MSELRWTVLVPLKALAGAKSRLATADGDEAAHRALVEAIRQDTLAAARAAAGVARVVRVVDAADPAGGLSFVQREPGLRSGLAEAGRWAAGQWPEDGVAVLLGDLPALRPDDLAVALVAAGSWPRSFVADRSGLGTTLLAVRPGQPLDPRFGSGSAAAHRASGAVELTAGPRLRTDVDTPEDLRAAVTLGLGPATAATLTPAHPVDLDTNTGL